MFFKKGDRVRGLIETTWEGTVMKDQEPGLNVDVDWDDFPYDPTPQERACDLELVFTHGPLEEVLQELNEDLEDDLYV